MSNTLTLVPRVLHALCAEADVSAETVRRRLRGLPLRPSTRARVEAAAEKLKVTLPPPGDAGGDAGDVGDDEGQDVSPPSAA